MNKFELIDKISMSIASIATKNNKYFSSTCDSRTLIEILAFLEVDIPIINGSGYYKSNVIYEGKIEEAAFRIEKWKGFNYPTIIYHHGAAEGSYDLSFNKILANKKNDIDANLIAIQAIFNHSNKEFIESIKDLSSYSLLLASSARLIEEIISQIKQKGDSKIIVVGTSLGGFVTNIHFTYFNSAQTYIPLLAGARLADVFLNSEYSKVTSKNIYNRKDLVKTVLNFDKDFIAVEQSNIFPLFAKYDQIVKYYVHNQDFLKENITTINYGHSTGATKFKLLRNHILKYL